MGLSRDNRAQLEDVDSESSSLDMSNALMEHDTPAIVTDNEVLIHRMCLD